MSPASIPVDLRNPGQVFACLGLMEMTEILSGSCMEMVADGKNWSENPLPPI
jgi:CRISPR-associated protein Csb3